MVWLCNAHAIPAKTGFMHGFAECGKRINQIITTLSYSRAGPLRIGPAITEGRMEARRASDGVKYRTVPAHFGNKFQPFYARHHFIATVCRIAGAGINDILHIQRVTVFINQLMRAKELQRFAALFAFVDHSFIADIRGRFLVDRADGAQLLLPPFTAHSPQLAIPPVSTQHSGQ